MKCCDFFKFYSKSLKSQIVDWTSTALKLANSMHNS